MSPSGRLELLLAVIVVVHVRFFASLSSSQSRLRQTKSQNADELS